MSREIIRVAYNYREDPRIRSWERDILEDFAKEMTMVLAEIEELKARIEESRASPARVNPDLLRRFKDILHRFLAIPTWIGSRTAAIRVEGKATEYLQKIWISGLRAIENFIENYKEELAVESWGISASVGFPLGLSGTISVTFKT